MHDGRLWTVLDVLDVATVMPTVGTGYSRRRTSADPRGRPGDSPSPQRDRTERRARSVQRAQTIRLRNPPGNNRLVRRPAATVSAEVGARTGQRSGDARMRDDGQFGIVFQPVFSLHGGQPWCHRGSRPPATSRSPRSAGPAGRYRHRRFWALYRVSSASLMSQLAASSAWAFAIRPVHDERARPVVGSASHGTWLPRSDLATGQPP